MSFWRNTLVEIGVRADEERSAEQIKPSVVFLADLAADRMANLLGALEVEGVEQCRPLVVDAAAALIRLAQELKA